MRDCLICEFCDGDYIFDPKTGEEYPFHSCEKGHDVDSELDCPDFKNCFSKPYKEKDAECDKCEYLSECKSKGNYTDCTTVDDKRSNVLCSKENFKKEVYEK